MLKKIAQVGLVSVAVLSASVGVAEQKVPFKNIAALAEENDLFFADAGFYYVLDRDQNLAWLLDEEGYFQGLVAFNRHDGVVRVMRDGKTEFEFSENDLVSSTLFSGFKEEYLPETRGLFQQIAGSRIVEPLGEILPTGALFTSSFTVELPDGEYLTWWPDTAARGVFVRNEETRDMRFAFLAELAPALNLSEESGNE